LGRSRKKSCIAEAKPTISSLLGSIKGTESSLMDEPKKEGGARELYKVLREGQVRRGVGRFSGNDRGEGNKTLA